MLIKVAIKLLGLGESHIRIRAYSILQSCSYVGKKESLHTQVLYRFVHL